MQHPTRESVLAVLAACDVMPPALNYGNEDGERYERAIAVLDRLGWLPDIEDVRDHDTFEAFDIAGITVLGATHHKILLTRPAPATPIEKLAIRVGDVEVEIQGEGADDLRRAIASIVAPPCAAEPLASRRAPDDVNVVSLHRNGRGRQGSPDAA